MVCATSGDCHLIVTLVEILAMCPFIFRNFASTHLLITMSEALLTLRITLTRVSLIFSRYFQSDSLPHLIFASTCCYFDRAFVGWVEECERVNNRKCFRAKLKERKEMNM